MKITFIINTLLVGGAAKMLKYVANLATEVFDEVSIIDIYDNAYTETDIKPEITIRCLSLGNAHRLQRWLIIIGLLKNSIYAENPDCVCSFVGHVNVMARLATLRKKNLSFISAERGDPFTQPLLWKVITRWAYRKSNYCFFQLAGARDFFDAETCQHSFVIPNPFIPSDYCEPFEGCRNKTIISAGRFAPEKCYDVLIASFANVLKHHPEYELILCGDGPLLDDYKKQINQLGINEKVHFPGYVKSVSQAVLKEGIFVLSSLYEGIPNSLIEAMSVGIPCIATDCTPGGPRFLTNNGNRGILIPVKDCNAMTNALLTMIENPDIANEYGKKALEVIPLLQENKIKQMWTDAFHIIINSISSNK